MTSMLMRREVAWKQLKRLALFALTFDISRRSVAAPKPGSNPRPNKRGCKEIAFALRTFASHIDVDSKRLESCGNICSKKVQNLRDSLGPGGRGMHINQRKQQFSTISRRQMEIMDACMHSGYYCLRSLAHLEVSKVSLIDAVADPLCVSQHSQFCQNSAKKTIGATLDSCLCLATLKLYRVAKADISIGQNLKNCSNVEICKRLSSRFPGNWHCINETIIIDPVCCSTRAQEIETWCDCNGKARSRNIIACQDLVWPVGKCNPLGASFLTDEMTTVFLQHARAELLGNIEANLRQGTVSSAMTSASAAGRLASPVVAHGGLSQSEYSPIQLLPHTQRSDTLPISFSEVSETRNTGTELMDQLDSIIFSEQRHQQQNRILSKAVLDREIRSNSEGKSTSLTSPESCLDDFVRQSKRLATAARMNEAAPSLAHQDPSQEFLKNSWRRTIEPLRMNSVNSESWIQTDVPNLFQTDFIVSDWSRFNEPIVLSDAGKEFWQENRIDDFLQMDLSVLDENGHSGACQMSNMGSEEICGAKSAPAQAEFGKGSHCSDSAKGEVEDQVYNDGKELEQCSRRLRPETDAQGSDNDQVCIDSDDLFDPDDHLML